MAVQNGQFAKVVLNVNGTNVDVMKLRDWSISVESEKIDSTAAGDRWERHEIGMLKWEGEATCIDADQYWFDMIETKVQIEFYDHEEDPAPAYKGTASIDFERSVDYSDVIESSLSFTGDGELERGTAA